MSHGVWAVLDQGLFASSNFAMGVLLARWLTAAEFGAFAVVYSAFLLLGTMHTALLSEPMLVFGSGRYRDSFTRYLSILLRGHWLLTTAGAGAFAMAAAAAWFSGSVMIAQALLGVAAAGPFILLSWLARRACFACLRPREAASGGGIYLLLMLPGSYLLFRSGSLTVFSALAVMGASSLIAALWIGSRLRGIQNEKAASADEPAVLREHWVYGRWALAASMVSWVPGNIYFVVLPLFGGLQAAAALKALMNLVMPILHANAALATLLLPSLVRVRGTPEFGRRLVLAGSLLVGSALAYWALVNAFSTSLTGWLYQGQYVEHAPLLWVVALLPLSGGLVAVLAAGLRSLERPYSIFRAYVAAALIACTVGVGAVWMWGIAGAAFGMLVPSAATAAILWRMLASSRPRVETEPNVAASARQPTLLHVMPRAGQA